MNAKLVGYWSTTGLLSAAMFGSGAGKLAKTEPLLESMNHLGMPEYMLTILGFWYVAAGLALLAPGLPRLKEWAYAGVVFAMTGGSAAHMFSGDGVVDSAATLILTCLAIASWALRPDGRKL